MYEDLLSYTLELNGKDESRVASVVIAVNRMRVDKSTIG